jgi:hypothetical protein
MIDKRLAAVAGLTMICGFCMNLIIQRIYPIEPRFHYGIGVPVLALELAHNAGDIQTVLPGAGYQPSERERTLKCKLPEGVRAGELKDRTVCPPWDGDAHRAIRWNTMLDLLFIPLYVAYLVLLSRTISLDGRYRKAVLSLAVLAGVFDYLEDWRIFEALQGGTPAVYLPSLAKWVCLGMTLALVAFRMIGPHRQFFSIASDRVLGLEYLIAGGSILTGAALGWRWGYGLIQAGVFVWAILVAITGLYVPILWFRRMLKPDLVRYVEDFCDPGRPHAPDAQAVREIS